MQSDNMKWVNIVVICDMQRYKPIQVEKGKGTCTLIIIETNRKTIRKCVTQQSPISRSIFLSLHGCPQLYLQHKATENYDQWSKTHSSTCTREDICFSEFFKTIASALHHGKRHLHNSATPFRLVHYTVISSTISKPLKGRKITSKTEAS